ncbi:transcription factor bHLH18-like [Diospyros lotus]|uniref:transcription factor bHLH18-like n=1 Tax=Diospyros lotus TaxID=55363 RepID=UPI002250E81B|nr:transcription factor bHLH18-like [Diospyros lotus]XP_052203948.1 transcription factor bHLH18-like [Diospyros lotus]
MDFSPAALLSELEMEDPTFFDHCQLESLDDSMNDFASFSAETCTNYPTSFGHKTPAIPIHEIDTMKPAKMMKTSHWSSACQAEKMAPKASNSSSSSSLISFGNSPPPQPLNGPQPLFGGLSAASKSKDENMMAQRNMNFSSYAISASSNKAVDFGEDAKKAGSAPRTKLQAKDHVMAERKRRQRLSQRIIALSALLPCLEKLDQASVLGDAIKYIKQLQERVKSLEEEAAKKPEESVISLKKSWISGDDNNSSSDEHSDSSSNQPFPEINVRISDTNVLLRIYCEKRNGLVVKILSEIEKLHLVVTNSNVMTFGDTTLALNIIAQMNNNQCPVTPKLLEETLRLALRS